MATRLLLILSLLFAPTAAGAQVQGPMPVVNVRGLPMNCTSFNGQLVAIFLNYSLMDVGMASWMMNGQPVIQNEPKHRWAVFRHSGGVVVRA